MTDILEQAREIAIASCEWRNVYKRDNFFECDCDIAARKILALAEPQWREIDDATVERATLAIEEDTFAPHELPLDDELHQKYLHTARAALEAALVLPAPPKEEER